MITVMCTMCRAMSDVEYLDEAAEDGWIVDENETVHRLIYGMCPNCAILDAHDEKVSP